MKYFSLQIIAIFLVILICDTRFGHCQTVVIKCDEAECARLCQEAYKEKLIKSCCQDLPPGFGRLCVCYHSDAINYVTEIEKKIKK